MIFWSENGNMKAMENGRGWKGKWKGKWRGWKIFYSLPKNYKSATQGRTSAHMYIPRSIPGNARQSAQRVNCGQKFSSSEKWNMIMDKSLNPGTCTWRNAIYCPRQSGQAIQRANSLKFTIQKMSLKCIEVWRHKMSIMDICQQYNQVTEGTSACIQPPPQSSPPTLPRTSPTRNEKALLEEEGRGEHQLRQKHAAKANTQGKSRVFRWVLGMSVLV